MFVGFIAVIVVILIIVALMSTGSTSGSGGVDQTKATKAVGEISALGQSIGFFKTTTTNNDYSGISIAKLIDAGIISSDDVIGSTADMKALPVTTGAVGATEESLTVVANSVIKSKAVKGLYYQVLPGATASTFVIRTVIDQATGAIAPVAANGADNGLRAAIEAAVAKLNNNGATVVLGTVNNDGLVGVTLR